MIGNYFSRFFLLWVVTHGESGSGQQHLFCSSSHVTRTEDWIGPNEVKRKRVSELNPLSPNQSLSISRVFQVGLLRTNTVWCGLHPVVTMAGPYFLRVYVRLRDADGGWRAPLPRRHGACHSDSIAQSRAEWRGPTPAALGATLVTRHIGWGGPGQRRHWPGCSEQLPSSSVHCPALAESEHRESLAVTPWVWTVDSGSSVVMISITGEWCLSDDSSDLSVFQSYTRYSYIRPPAVAVLFVVHATSLLSCLIDK